MSAQLPQDPVAFIARAEQATNSRDVDWAMSTYAKTIRLETYGDGVCEVSEGYADVRRVVATIYDWLQAIDGRIRKTLIVAANDVLVNQWEGSLLGAKSATYGAEFWYFDGTGHVTRNVLYQSLDPKPLFHPLTGVRSLFSHPRLSISYLAARGRARRASREPIGVAAAGRS